MQVVSACHLEIFAFPFDRQNCTLTFRSWLHSVNELDLALWRSAEEIASQFKEFMNDSEWELLSIPSHYWTLNIDDREYAHIQFNVLIRRRPLQYVVSLLIPSIFFMVVDVISFYLPPNSGIRVTFKTSILLGYTMIRVNLMDEIPATAIKTPLIGIFFAVCMALLVLSLAKSIFVVKLLHYSESDVKKMSISACLLDKYGSTDQSFNESAFTSVKTLYDVDQSGGYELDFSSETDLVSLTDDAHSDSPLEKILQEMVYLKMCLQEEDNERSANAYWVALCLKVDKLLFRVYVMLVLIYSMTLLLLWSGWSSV
ncbi:5-hydroxytryptamine receptor 3A [Misgurnus anguillicaudatus]|uniref:5-hydroxytryptamine receptor 3A n=1 Tax=Misgurnus anguillicaudatus TaxID=75329 RepID=UPI002434C7F6|nr:5-hydroxytryptamine receptor 3A [Misgurnus anguillicaudatus]